MKHNGDQKENENNNNNHDVNNNHKPKSASRERVDELKLIQQLMWEHYRACKDPYQKVKMIESIVGVQPYLSSYYEATHFVAKEAGDTI